MVRVTIDSTSRFEGHCRIKAEVNGGNHVSTENQSNGSLVRSFEKDLQKQDLRDKHFLQKGFVGSARVVIPYIVFLSLYLISKSGGKGGVAEES